MRPSNKPGETKDLAAYNLLLEGWHTQKSHFLYGWAVNDSMLYSMLGKRPGEYDESTLDCRAIFMLERRTSFGEIMFVNAKVTADSPSVDRIVRMEDGTPCLRVFALSCSKNRRLFMRRPTKQQMKMFVNFFGEEPRWYEDFYLKEDFADYGY